MTMNPVLHSIAYSLDFVRELVADLADTNMVAQPPSIPNHPAWVIGHLTFSCQEPGGVIGLPAWLPQDWRSRFGPGSMPTAEVSAYESKTDALKILTDAQSRITQAVAHLKDPELDQPFPDESYRAVFPTIRYALTQVKVGHATYHVGQLSVWQRAMDLPPLGRSFE
jgi:hypothetical protein